MLLDSGASFYSHNNFSPAWQNLMECPKQVPAGTPWSTKPWGGQLIGAEPGAGCYSVCVTGSLTRKVVFTETFPVPGEKQSCHRHPVSHLLSHRQMFLSMVPGPHCLPWQAVPDALLPSQGRKGRSLIDTWPVAMGANQGTAQPSGNLNEWSSCKAGTGREQAGGGSIPVLLLQHWARSNTLNTDK